MDCLGLIDGKDSDVLLAISIKSTVMIALIFVLSPIIFFTTTQQMKKQQLHYSFRCKMIVLAILIQLALVYRLVFTWWAYFGIDAR